MAYVPVDAQCREQAEVWKKRYFEAREYGFTRVEARLFAESEVDTGELRRLQRLGCPPALAARVIL